MPRRALFSVFALAVGTPLAAGLGGASMLQAILGIGFLIFIHEWGHYTACRMTGTKTEAFSVGFGPRLFGWERDADGSRRFTVGARQLDPESGAMDFRVALIPLGGYVKMAGGEILGESSSKDPDHFINKSAGARIFIVSAGVIMNMITAFVFYVIVFAAGKQVQPPVVGDVVPGGAAWEAGLQAGDTIKSIDGSRTRSFYDVRIASVFADPDAGVEVEIERDGNPMSVSLKPRYVEALGRLEIGLAAATTLQIPAGDKTHVIGPADPVTIGGVEVLGGLEAKTLLLDALQSGRDSVEVQLADGTAVQVAVEPEERPADAEAPRLVGLGMMQALRIDSVRSDATDTGVEAGDVLLEALGEAAPVDLRYPTSWSTLALAAPIRSLKVQRGEAEATVTLDLSDAAAVRRWQSALAVEPVADEARVTVVTPGRLMQSESGFWRYETVPAAEAGVRTGDQVVRIGTTDVTTFAEILKALRALPENKSATLSVRTGDEEPREVVLTPQPLGWVGTLGVTENPRVLLETEGFGDAVGLAATQTGREVGNVFRTIGALFSGNLSFNKNIAGPVRLIGLSKRLAEQGWVDLLWFLAYVSVMLAVLNILPIPVLDGGHLLFILIEKVKGSPLNEKVMIGAMYIGLFLLLTLMFFAFKNDITYYLFD